MTVLTEKTTKPISVKSFSTTFVKKKKYKVLKS